MVTTCWQQKLTSICANVSFIQWRKCFGNYSGLVVLKGNLLALIVAWENESLGTSPFKAGQVLQASAHGSMEPCSIGLRAKTQTTKMELLLLWI